MIYRFIIIKRKDETKRETREENKRTTMNMSLQNYENENIENLFNSNLEVFKQISLNDVAEKKEGELVIFRRIKSSHHRKKEAVDYIGRIWKVEKKITRKIVTNITHIIGYYTQILYKREGYCYKSKRYMKKNPKWVRHDEYLYNIHSIYYRKFNEYSDYVSNYVNYGFVSKYGIDKKWTTILTPIKDEKNIGYYYNKNSFYTDNEIENRRIKELKYKMKEMVIEYQYFELPVSVGSVFSSVSLSENLIRLISETVGPEELKEINHILFCKFPYDIYRNILGYL